jgi:hypothetical protein
MAFAQGQGDEADQLTLTYYLESKALEISAHGSVPERQGTVGSGRIVSIPDLVGARMVVVAQHPSQHAAAGLPPAPMEAMSPKFVTLVIGERFFWLRAKDFTTFQGPAGQSGYVFQFPGSKDELVRTLSIEEASLRTGRTELSVKSRRRTLRGKRQGGGGPPWITPIARG